MKTDWHIITGEYPPRAGGVGDYAELLAAGLAGEGCAVRVWCPENAGAAPAHPGVEVRRLRQGFRPSGLLRLGAALSRERRPRTLLVQYAPNALGLRGLNLPFCLWLLSRRVVSGDDVRVMFHEPFFYFARQRPLLNVLAFVHRIMAVLLLASARVVYVSTPAWRQLLRPFAWPRRLRAVWLPIPSTIPVADDRGAVERLRARYARGEAGRVVVGHFGTYGAHAADTVSLVLKGLLSQRPEAVGLCLGERSEEFVAGMLRAHPELEGRLQAAGRLSPRDVSLHLQACDLIVQPYPDGATARRTSLMAGLAHGLPAVSNLGELSEPMWPGSPALLLAETPAADELIGLAASLVADPLRRRRVGGEARRFYQEHFQPRRGLDALTRAVPREVGHEFAGAPGADRFGHVARSRK